MSGCAPVETDGLASTDLALAFTGAGVMFAAGGAGVVTAEEVWSSFGTGWTVLPERLPDDLRLVAERR